MYTYLPTDTTYIPKSPLATTLDMEKKKIIIFCCCILSNFPNFYCRYILAIILHTYIDIYIHLRRSRRIKVNYFLFVFQKKEKNVFSFSFFFHTWILVERISTYVCICFFFSWRMKMKWGKKSFGIFPFLLFESYISLLK